MLRKLLPMAGHTRGNRLAITCELKCGSACSFDVCNKSDNSYFPDIAERAISRRALIGYGSGVAAAIAVGVNTLNAPGAAADHGTFGKGGGKLNFKAIAPVPRNVDAMSYPAGYTDHVIIRWGDPLFNSTPNFNITKQSAKAQAEQFGYNCDYLNILHDGGNARTGVLVSNHEYTNENIMFDPAFIAANPAEVAKIGIAAHGFSVVDIKRAKVGHPWEYVRGGRRNRRITGDTPFTVSGPAAGSDLLKTVEDPTGKLVLGTLNNCAGGTTPWGTVMSGEENCNQYFRGRGTPEEARYGVQARPTSRGWENHMDRFDLTKEGYENEINRFGYIVEIDPEDPNSTPVKHTALGRFKHEGGNVRIADNGHAVVYMGDDERFDYVYKFVSHGKYIPGNKKHNMTLLASGDLYVARFDGNSEGEIDGTGAVPADGAFDGRGKWIALTKNNKSMVPGMDIDEVLVYTRQAADKMGATKMDRPEDVDVNPKTGKVYIALTNNTRRGNAGQPGADEANPRTINRDGHVIEFTETRNDATATTFTWNILLVAGDPRKDDSTYFSGFPKELVSPISCPDNLTFDSDGNLWISTDGQPGTMGLCDALHKVTLTGSERGKVEQFLAVPAGAETCGPVVHDREDTVFVAVQHPGEDGNWGAHTSYWPDMLGANSPLQVGDKVAAPRPSIVMVYKPAKSNPGGGAAKDKNNKGNKGKGNQGKNQNKGKGNNNGKGKGNNK